MWQHTFLKKRTAFSPGEMITWTLACLSWRLVVISVSICGDEITASFTKIRGQAHVCPVFTSLGSHAAGADRTCGITHGCLQHHAGLSTGSIDSVRCFHLQMLPDVVRGVTAATRREMAGYRGLHLDKRHESGPEWRNVRNFDSSRLAASLNKAPPTFVSPGSFHNGCVLDNLGTWPELLPWFSRGSPSRHGQGLVECPFLTRLTYDAARIGERLP
jgi:hypothetical protein